MLYAGIDAGSRSIKVAIVDGTTLDVVGSGCVDQGVDQSALAKALFARVLAEAGVKRKAVGRVVATGYGRAAVRAADTTVTEITCHARGVCHDMPETRTIIEIGGQDSKLIRMDGDGTVRDFAMNDRCAAGTGCFLEVVARRMGVALEALGAMSARSVEPAGISSTCVVFAETEIVGLLASGRPADDIVAGVQRAIASRVATMAGNSIEHPVVLTGGVALVSGMVQALASVLDCAVAVATRPQMTGAIGAAILAARKT